MNEYTQVDTQALVQAAAESQIAIQVEGQVFIGWIINFCYFAPDFKSAEPVEFSFSNTFAPWDSHWETHHCETYFKISEVEAFYVISRRILPTRGGGQ